MNTDLEAQQAEMRHKRGVRGTAEFGCSTRRPKEKGGQGVRPCELELSFRDSRRIRNFNRSVMSEFESLIAGVAQS
jgi:hypothetical protein